MRWSDPYPVTLECHGNLDDNTSVTLECRNGDGKIWTLSCVCIGYVDILVDHSGTLEECKTKAEAAYQWALSKHPISYFADETKHVGIHCIRYEP